MPKSTVYRKNTSIILLLVVIIMVIAGVFVLLLSEFMEQWGYPHWKPVLSSIGGLLIASIGLAVVWELIVRRAFFDEIFDLARIADEVHSAKIIGITTDFSHGVKWAELFDVSKEIDLFVSHAQTWRNTHAQHFLDLAKRPDAKINIILPDPDNNQIVEELARRFDYEKTDLIRSINDTDKAFRRLATEASMPRGHLKIWHSSVAPLYTCYRFDNVYIYVSYRYSGKWQVITIVCHEGGSIADFLRDQVKELIRPGGLAKQVFPLKAQSARADTAQEDESDTNLNTTK